MTQKEICDQWEAPRAPKGLGERVVLTAKAEAVKWHAMCLEERVWHSRALRWSWLAAATLLLAINLMTLTQPSRKYTVHPVVSADPVINDPYIKRLYLHHEVARIRLSESRDMFNQLVIGGKIDAGQTPEHGEST